MYSMYECIYVCNVCMRVLIVSAFIVFLVNVYVCMYNVYNMYVCMHVCTCMYVCMYVCMNACVYICMYVHMNDTR